MSTSKSTELGGVTIWKKAPSRARNFVFTWFSYPENWRKLLDESIKDDIVFYQIQAEVTKTEKLHLQGYVMLNKKVSMKKIGGLFKWNTGVPYAPSANNIAYCCKEESRVAGPWNHGKPKSQGERTDLLEVKKCIDEGGSLWDVAQQHFQAFVKYPRGIQLYMSVRSQHLSREFRHVTCEWITGKSGTGKTRQALYDPVTLLRKESTFMVKDASPMWFDGYQGEKTIVIDEMYGNMPYGLFLGIADGHQLRLAVKGAHQWAMWTHIIVTSNAPPEDWYEGGLTEAMIRRFVKADPKPGRVFASPAGPQIEDYSTDFTRHASRVARQGASPDVSNGRCKRKRSIQEELIHHGSTMRLKGTQ